MESYFKITSSGKNMMAFCLTVMESHWLSCVGSNRKQSVGFLYSRIEVILNKIASIVSLGNVIYFIKIDR